MLLLAADLCQAVKAAIFHTCYIDVLCPRLVVANLRTCNWTICRVYMQLQGHQGPCMRVWGCWSSCACAEDKGGADAERDTAEMPDATAIDLPEGSPTQNLMQDVMAEVEAVVAEVTAEVGGAARRYCRLLQSSMFKPILQINLAIYMKHFGKSQ